MEPDEIRFYIAFFIDSVFRITDTHGTLVHGKDALYDSFNMPGYYVVVHIPGVPFKQIKSSSPNVFHPHLYVNLVLNGSTR